MRLQAVLLIMHLSDFVQSGIFHVLERASMRLWKTRQFLLFKKIYRSAFNNTDFYRDFYRKRDLNQNSIKTISDITRLPVIYKEDLKSFPEEFFINKQVDCNRFYRRKTSGSTGQPIEFIRDAKYLSRVKSFYYLNYKWFDISPNVRRICLKSPDGSKRFWESADTLYIYFNDFQKDVEKNIILIEKFRPISIEAHPSYLVFLANAFAKAGKKIRVPHIVSYGEQMLEEERWFLKEAFRAEVTSFYGLNEAGDLGIECEKHDGFHVNEVNAFVEIVDEAGQPVNGEAEGDIIVTSFINEVMPLVRYSTGDRGKWILEPCFCGRTWRRVRLLGRRNDALTTPEGKTIFSFYLNPIFNAYFDEIKQYQLVQRATDEFLLTITPSAFFKKETEVNLTSDLSFLLGAGAKIKIKKTDFIPWDKNGKRKFIINEIQGGFK